MHEHDGCDYVIAVQEGGTLEKLDPLPKLPANARFVRHENKCFDLGTIGWMLDTKVVNPRYVSCWTLFLAFQGAPECTMPSKIV